jgi:RNase H-fold protein (predicted Holliday junction resolvase)
MNIKIIGLDISRKRIGMSIGIYQNNNHIITPFNVLEEYSDFMVIETLKKLKKDYSPNNFVIGLPSKSYENAKFIKHFVHKYREYLKPFIYQNEDYTTFLSNYIIYTLTTYKRILYILYFLNFVCIYI